MKKLKMGLMLTLIAVVGAVAYSGISSVWANPVKKVAQSGEPIGEALVTCDSGQSKRSKCTNTSADAYYQITGEYNAESRNITINAAHGSFTVTIPTSDEDENVAYTGTLPSVRSYTLKAGTPLVIDLSNVGDAVLRFEALLNEDSALESGGENYCRAGCYRKTIQITVSGDTGSDLVANTSLEKGNACYEFLNSEDYLAAGTDGQAYYKANLNYCFSENVTANYSESTVKSMISTVKLAWKLKNTPLVNDNIDSAKKGEEVKKKSDGTRNVGNLQCDAFSREKNVNQYYTTESTNVNDVCSVDCVEELTVTYGPPSSVKAGLCFEYTVTVRSKVSCKTTIKENPPTKKNVCNPYPVCNSYVNYTDQGGPNEDFDACVQECDGGDYSQSCINKCYKKVYGSANEKVMLSYDDAVATKTAVSCSGARGNKSANYQDVYNEISRTPGGHYEFVGNSSTIKWVNDSKCYWDGLGSYYFRSLDKAGRTVVNIQGGTWGRFKGGYYIDSKGFKVAYNCSESCEWKGCTNDGNTALSEEAAQDEYNKALEEYNKKIEECTSYNACIDNTATFTMAVDTSTDAGTITFGPSDNYSKSKPTDSDRKLTNNKDDSGIIKEQGGVCYGEANSEEDDYRTTINFPGSWIDNKTGKVVYKAPSKTEEAYYSSEPDQFCTSLDQKDVNVKWWYWSERKCTADNISTCSGYSKEDILAETNSNQNIRATVENFGKYKWSINISCFYAVNNETIPTTPDTPDTPDPDEPTETDISNYSFRIVDLNDLFPSSSGEESTGTTPNRETGFNWSADATNVNNSDYEITPTALIASIQTVGNKIYDEANENQYLDYEIILDTKTLKAIKNDYDSKTYGVFGYDTSLSKTNEVITENGVTSYKSGLLTSLGSNLKKRGLIGCNNQANATTCETFTDDLVSLKRDLASMNSGT